MTLMTLLNPSLLQGDPRSNPDLQVATLAAMKCVQWVEDAPNHLNTARTREGFETAIARVLQVGFPLIQQFRPDGNDHDRCLFDQMVLRPKPSDGSSFQVAEVVHIGEDESYTSAKDLDPFLAHVLDQDTNDEQNRHGDQQ